MKKREKRYVYIGETNRSVYECGIEHQNDISACKTSTHMLRHLLDVNEESVLIQKARHNNIMNNKAEYNCCALPRLTAKLGERDLDKWREEDRRELEKEATIEEKIRIRKKEKAKRRGTANRRMEHGQPTRRREELKQD